MTDDSVQEPESAIWEGHEALFLDQLDAFLDRNDFSECGAFRHTPEKFIRSRARIYQGEKLDRVMINRYSLRRGRAGLVIFAYPRVEYDIPAFLLHVGGHPPDKTLLTLDLAPCSPDTDMAPFAAVAQTHRPAMGLPDGRLEWLASVTSPHLMHCAFKAIEPGLFFNALQATIETWRDAYIEPAQRDENAARVQVRREMVLEMKKVIFRNDPAFPVFTRAFGKAMSDVLAEVAFGGDPGLSIAEATEPPPAPGSWVNKKLGIGWHADAQERVHEAPAFLRPMIRRMIEKEAVKEGASQVSMELVLQCEKKYRGNMEL
ncbi:protochlorophyllide oxidoreductase [Thiorhodococcus mannitoliphagus]|uniref:Protochlorophyllide oxidoreductase n=1 Tax=Thiorhodococcus mannitoliphagus TaxID=329406 RepID=A0A6P1E1N7_9GAMM|nr:protochlorophyllide oxidoreductase [Thiorhodococcus mannitoliphagus]NEX21904.1 protochlorophyllide oxidoreductase [Thiorhodococcus mannitoliphagus]